MKTFITTFLICFFYFNSFGQEQDKSFYSFRAKMSTFYRWNNNIEKWEKIEEPNYTNILITYDFNDLLITIYSKETQKVSLIEYLGVFEDTNGNSYYAYNALDQYNNKIYLKHTFIDDYQTLCLIYDDLLVEFHIFVVQ